MLRIASRWRQHATKVYMHKIASLRSACFHSPSRTMKAFSENHLDPYAYTSGRWLRNDKLERDARFIQFDFDALCRRVVELCPGAASIESYEKKEGGYNRVFVFTCDNGRRVVAKLPTMVAGPPRLTTNSEVATISYLQFNTTVPIPKILDWSDDPSNAIGHEYIISEHASGTSLHQKWPTMSGEQQIECIQAICRNIQQVAAINFPAYGSLYFTDAPFNSELKLPLAPNFCIGPHCGTRYWDCNVAGARYYKAVKPNRGPWPDLTAYCNGLVDTGISRLPVDDTILEKRPYHGSVATHTELLSIGRKVIEKLAEEPRVQGCAVPTLVHADLHKRNLFVDNDDPTVITSFIDWQSTSIEPAFEHADETPDFAAPEFAVSSEDSNPGNNNELCRQAFDACLQGLVPKLSDARRIDDTLLRPFRYCHRTWQDGAVAFRQELIEVSSRWKELGLSGSCPYELPTTDELLAHQHEYETFVTAHGLKQKLMLLLDTTPDGWVPVSLWETTKKAHEEALEEFLQAVASSESAGDQSMTQEDLKDIWPFDIK